MRNPMYDQRQRPPVYRFHIQNDNDYNKQRRRRQKLITL